MHRNATRNRHRGLGIGLGVGMAIALTGQAQDAPQTIELDEVVVTATRTAVSTKQLPTNVTVITGEDIAAGNFSDVVDVLKRRGGIHFRSYSGNQEAEVDLRGFGENSHGRVLILRNGRKLNRPDMRSINWSQIPLATVERIEILRGPNGAIYGDHAVGGVINIITKKGSESPVTEVVVEAGTEKFNRQLLSTLGSVDGLDYAFSMERSGTEGWRDRTGARTEGGDLSLGYAVSEGVRLDIDFNALTTDYELPGWTNEATYEADPTRAGILSDEAKEEHFGISPSLTAQVGTDAELSLDLGFSRKAIETDMASWWLWSDLDIDTWTASPRYVSTAPLGELPNRLTLGADWTRDLLELQRFTSAARTNYNGGADVTKNTVALYAVNALTLADGVTVSAGVRAARSTFAVEQDNAAGALVDDDDDTHREEGYHLGLTWNPTETSKLFVKFEHFFRLPFTDEQISYQGFGGTLFNKDLQPETGDSIEVGIEQQLPGAMTLTGTLFHMQMDDEIAWDGAKNANLSETIHEGLELALSAEPFSQLSLYGSYAWLNAEFDGGQNDGNEIPLVPRHKIAVGAEIRPLESLRVSLDVTYTSQMFLGNDNANAGDKLSEAVVVGFGVAYTVEVRETDWEIFAGVSNLFDEDYSDFSYGWGYYAAPGRTCKVGLKASF